MVEILREGLSEGVTPQPREGLIWSRYFSITRSSQSFCREFGCKLSQEGKGFSELIVLGSAGLWIQLLTWFGAQHCPC